MPVLNPFLRALFQSSVLGHALPAQNYVLLVPSTESLLYGQDRDAGKPYVDQCNDEDFLGSHILRIPPTTTAKEGSLRDSRTKARTYSTVNGRTVILKENVVYSNKGFKNLTQAQILNDVLYYAGGVETQQWLVYYITKPLTGTFEPLPIKSAIVGETTSSPAASRASPAQPATPKKKDIKTFNELLNNFPMIARQMQPGLERLFNEFGKELGRPLPPPPSRSPSLVSIDGTTTVATSSENGSIRSNGSVKLPFNHAAYFDDEEDLMRRALETAVTAAIDLFQGVDKQQLSYLGATTDLTGPDVEKLIERYVAESVHDSLLFPRLCSFHKAADQELDRRIRQMDCLDVSQVGIAVEDGRQGKRDLIGRINRGVAIFRKMGLAGSPQEMLDILLETQKVVSTAEGISDQEKRAAAMTINADVLVSLLLLVVIRSNVRHMQARLSYMQRFIYIDDVESGEIGYSLSTLEAVLTYLGRDAAGLRKASKQNSLLWNAVKGGRVDEMRSIFEESAVIADEIVDEPDEIPLSRMSTRSARSSFTDLRPTLSRGSSAEGGLSHVFPFQNGDRKQSSHKQKKKVKLASRSMSISSTFSLSSRTATIETTLSGIEGDTSVQSLAQTQDASGNSVLMMAVENRQPQALRYLFSLSDHYSPEIILSDVTSENTTLLSSAVQLANTELVDILLSFAEANASEHEFRSYIALRDTRGRSVAHYLFNTPSLIDRLAHILPWTQRDNIGHTPLFAICRAYDHPDYTSMISSALTAATAAQGEGRLRLEDHSDNKSNTLLHVINDPALANRVLRECDADVNACNDRKFTPLMLASKYGRVDMVRVFLGDPRVDIHLRENRGLTAVELAKDDEVRNRIDDLTLFSTNNDPDADGRVTGIVRGFFVEDGTSRYILKSGSPNPAVNSRTFTITTSRRSLQDFENLATWLKMEMPASYMQSMAATQFRSPFQLHSRPSRAVLYDCQMRLDRFLKSLLGHPTFGAHEMLWEFLLVPDMTPDTMEQRARLKAELTKEKINEEYEPLTQRTEMTMVENLMGESRDMVRRIGVASRSVVKRGRGLVQAQADFAESLSLCSVAFATLGSPATALPVRHVGAFVRLAGLTHSDGATSPLGTFVSALASFHDSILAVQAALIRPSELINHIVKVHRDVQSSKRDLASGTLPRRGLLGLSSEEGREKGRRELEEKIRKGETGASDLGRELRYSTEVVVGELAGWTGWRERWGRDVIKKLAKGVVVKEKERLGGMERTLRALREN